MIQHHSHVLWFPINTGVVRCLQFIFAQKVAKNWKYHTRADKSWHCLLVIFERFLGDLSSSCNYQTAMRDINALSQSFK